MYSMDVTDQERADYEADMAAEMAILQAEIALLHELEAEQEDEAAVAAAEAQYDAWVNR